MNTLNKFFLISYDIVGEGAKMMSLNRFLFSAFLLSTSAIAATDEFLCRYSFEDEGGTLYAGNGHFEVNRKLLKKEGNVTFLYGEIGNFSGFGSGARRDSDFISSHYHYAYYLAVRHDANERVSEAWQSSYCVDADYGWGPIGLSVDCPNIAKFPGNKWSSISVENGLPILDAAKFIELSHSEQDAKGTYNFACQYLGTKK